MGSYPLTLQLADENDRPFLLRLYGDTRTEELKSMGWNDVQRSFFVSMQFTARERSYRAQFPSAINHVVWLDGCPIGCLSVDRSADKIHLVDLALLSGYRNRGIGTQLLQQLMAESQTRQIPLHLSVFQGNPAVRLYERLGFRIVGEASMYWQMERNATVPVVG